MDQKPACSYSSTAPAARVLSPLKKVQVVYYLSYRSGLLEQPHLLEVSLSASRGLCLKDVKSRLATLRGRMMFSSFSWSYKRSYKEGFVWQDLESDDDLIFPTHGGSEYVMKGCKIESSCTLAQILASPPNMPCNSTEILHGISASMMPARVAELLVPSMATECAKTMSLVANDDYANKIVVGSPSNALLRGCDDNITKNLGIIEGLEQLPLSKAINLHNNYAESQASTSLNHNYHDREQNTRNTQNLRQSKEASDSKLHLKVPLNIERQQYEFPVFSVVKKVEGDCGTSSNPSLFVGADVATQTGEDDEIADVASGQCHGKGKAVCPPDYYHADELQCPKRREGPSLKQRVSLQSALTELSGDEISPPPCSTSSSSTITSGNSASSSNAVTLLSLNRLSRLAEDQNLQDMEIIPSLRIDSDEDVLFNEEETRASCKPSTLGSNPDGRTTPILSADSNENSSSEAGDHSCKDQKSVSNSFKVKPHVMSICSNSGRFLSLVSCGRGVDAIKPSGMHIRRNSSMRSMDADDCGEVSDRQYSSLMNVTADENSCLDSSSPNVNSESETATANMESSLHSNATDDVSGRLFAIAESSWQAAALSPQDANTNNKKIWPLRGWFHSQHKKRRSTRSKSICNNSTANEDIDECLDLFEKHAVISGAGLNAEEISSQSRCIRVGRADQPSNNHQRSLSYDSNPSTRWVVSTLKRPGNRSCRLTTSLYSPSKYGYDERNSFPVFGQDIWEAKKGTSSMLQKS